MSSFSARLWITGQSRILLGVRVDVTDDDITITSADREVARWSLDEIDINRSSDGFHINGDGKELVLGVTESSQFASAVGVGLELRDPPLVNRGVFHMRRNATARHAPALGALMLGLSTVFTMLNFLRP